MCGSHTRTLSCTQHVSKGKLAAGRCLLCLARQCACAVPSSTPPHGRRQHTTIVAKRCNLPTVEPFNATNADRTAEPGHDDASGTADARADFNSNRIDPWQDGWPSAAQWHHIFLVLLEAAVTSRRPDNQHTTTIGSSSTTCLHMLHSCMENVPPPPALPLNRPRLVWDLPLQSNMPCCKPPRSRCTGLFHANHSKHLLLIGPALMEDCTQSAQPCIHHSAQYYIATTDAYNATRSVYHVDADWSA